LKLALCNGCGAGGVIALEMVSEVQEELAGLRRGAPISIQFASFLDDLDHFAAASVEQRNPIVFL
jgi:hypothetical protein